MKVSELEGPGLCWAVAKAEGRLGLRGLDAQSAVIVIGRQLYCTGYDGDRELYEPDCDWAQGGPIIERESIQLTPNEDMVSWSAGLMFRQGFEDYSGPTPLIAAMRCFVAYKLGSEVEVSQELIA